MYLLAKFDGHRSYGNGDISSYTKAYMNTLEKVNSLPRSAVLRDFQSGKPIYSFEVPEKVGRKIQPIARR